MAYKSDAVSNWTDKQASKLRCRYCNARLKVTDFISVPCCLDCGLLHSRIKDDPDPVATRTAKSIRMQIYRQQRRRIRDKYLRFG